MWWRDPEWLSVRYVDVENFASPASKTGDPLLTISLRTGGVRKLRIEAREDRVAAVWTFVHFLMRVVGDRKREAAAG
jgi:hypothetical protein